MSDEKVGAQEPTQAPIQDKSGEEVKASPDIVETTKTDKVTLLAPSTVPEKYEFKAPEGVKIDPAWVSETEAYAKAQRLDQTQAQALFEHDLSIRSACSQRIQQEQATVLNKVTQEWYTASQSDKEFGGQEFNKNVELAQRTVKEFFPESVIEYLNQSGLGNHPDAVRGFVRIGKLLQERQLVQGSMGFKKPKTLVERFYGSEQVKKEE